MADLAIAAKPTDMRLVRRSILSMPEPEMQRIKMIVDYLGDSQLAIAKNGSDRMSKGDIALIIFKGLEVGLEPMAALESIDLISGKPTLDPAGMLALVQASGQLEDIQFIEETDVVSHITMKRVGQSPYTRIFTIEDARRMTTTEWVNKVRQTVPLTKKANWKAMPSIMLKCRNISQMCRYLFGDVIQGLYTPEELGAAVSVDADGHMVVLHTDAPQRELATGQQPPTTPPPAPPEGMKGTWATPETIGKILSMFAEEKNGSLTATEVFKLAGIESEKGREPAEWNRLYTSGKEAGQTIKAAFEKALTDKPATPKTPPVLDDEMLIAALEDLYPHTLADFEEALGYALLEKALTLQDALTRVASVITSNVWSVLAQAGTYKVTTGKAPQHYTELETGIGAIRVYGRDTFKKMSESFYDENGIEKWEAGKRYEFNAPLVISWEQKQGYKVATEIDLFVADGGFEQDEASEAEKEFNALGQP